MTRHTDNISTVVWFHARNGQSTGEARQVFAALAQMQPKVFGPTETWRSSRPGDTTTFLYKVDGDVRQAVQERLAELTTLPVEIDIVEPYEP